MYFIFSFRFIFSYSLLFHFICLKRGYRVCVFIFNPLWSASNFVVSIKWLLIAIIHMYLLKKLYLAGLCKIKKVSLLQEGKLYLLPIVKINIIWFIKYRKYPTNWRKKLSNRKPSFIVILKREGGRKEKGLSTQIYCPHWQQIK